MTEPSALLESAASSLEPSTRASAIGPLILSDPGDTWVQRGLFDPDPWVQRAACFAALQKGSYDQVIEYLARTTDAYVRGEVGATLARTGTHQDALPTLWTPATDAIDAPLALPAAILGNQDALSFLGESLASGEVALEYTFMAAIGESSLPALIPFLQTGEEAVEEELRLAYAAARLALGDPSASQPFKQALSGSNPEQALEALDYLTEIPTTEAAQLLRRGQASQDAEVAWYSGLALAARGQAGHQKLIDAFEESNWEVRLWATQSAITLVQTPTIERKYLAAARQTLERAARDENPVIRRKMTEALPHIEPELAASLIALLLADTELSVRVAAAGAAMQHP